MFTVPVAGLGKTVINDDFMKNRSAYPCPLRFPKFVSLKNLVLIKNPKHANNAFYKISLINPSDTHVEYFFKDTVFDFNIDDDLKVEVAG